jgi:hypothetical protein
VILTLLLVQHVAGHVDVDGMDTLLSLVPFNGIIYMSQGRGTWGLILLLAGAGGLAFKLYDGTK